MRKMGSLTDPWNTRPVDAGFEKLPLETRRRAGGTSRFSENSRTVFKNQRFFIDTLIFINSYTFLFARFTMSSYSRNI